MAQTVITGRTGSVTGLACRIYLWRARLHTDALETTGFGSVWRQRTPGFQDATGSAVARLTRGTATDDPTLLFGGSEYVINLFANSSPACAISFLAVVENVSIEDNVDRVAEVTFDFSSDGTVTTQWDET